MAQVREPITDAGAGAFTPEQNKQVIRRYGEALWSRAEIDVADEVLHPNIYAPPPSFLEPAGFEDFKAIVQALKKAFPDGHFTNEDMVAEGDKVAVRWTFEGTHEGEFMGHAPSGRRRQFQVIGIYRLEQGKIIEVHKLNVGTDFLTALGFGS